MLKAGSRGGSRLAPARSVTAVTSPRRQVGWRKLRCNRASRNAIAIGATMSSAVMYRGVLTNDAGAVRSGEQGALWQSRFVEHRRGRMEYSACVTFLDARAAVLCKAGRTNSHGIDRVSFSEFVNMRPGHRVVRFFKLGHKLASWRSRLPARKAPERFH